jgi:lipopolysaccharide/colanic/teichoic acid biosynthesis glycosyltransferase
MNDKRDVDGSFLPDHIRLKNTGKLLRKLSIDELPQLLIVLLGDKSLIGPRPLSVSYLPLNYWLSKQKAYSSTRN